MKDNIKAARLRIGMTQEELANRMNVTQAAVSHWEQGISFPNSRQIVTLAEVLKTTVAELFGEKVTA